MLLGFVVLLGVLVLSGFLVLLGFVATFCSCASIAALRHLRLAEGVSRSPDSYGSMNLDPPSALY